MNLRDPMDLFLRGEDSQTSCSVCKLICTYQFILNLENIICDKESLLKGPRHVYSDLHLTIPVSPKTQFLL